MKNIFKILILPGDGVGPEVINEVKKVISFFQASNTIDFNIDEDLIGGAALDKSKLPITDSTLSKALESDVVLLGAVGGPKWDNNEFSKKPEQGLLRLRKQMGLFANLRPAICFNSLIEASTLKPSVVSNLDIMIVRELTGGVYFGEPRGIEKLADGQEKGFNTQVYTTNEIQRIAKVAFDLAKGRKSNLVSCDKANVMESGVLWRQEVQNIGDKLYPEIILKHMYADNCAMQLVRNPSQFDVILADNLFGDILSDEASMLTGSLGMLPSASLGDVDSKGLRKALYEPVHGSAPDIAGKNIANPIASILSFAMALRYSFGCVKESDLLNRAINNVLEKNYRTKDIMQESKREVSTSEMGDAIIEELAK